MTRRVQGRTTTLGVGSRPWKGVGSWPPEPRVPLEGSGPSALPLPAPHQPASWPLPVPDKCLLDPWVLIPQRDGLQGTRRA